MSWPIPHVLQDDLEYELTLWGEFINGTKEAIQRLGIGVGMAFPGESGANKQKMTMVDPRGFCCMIERSDDWSRFPYCAKIILPAREYDEKRWEDFAPGVRKSSALSWCDEYVGTGEALAAAGLIRFDQLPGQPGMGKVSVVILPDGAISSPGHSLRKIHKFGVKQIERKGKNRYRLYVVVSKDERARRDEAGSRANAEWEARMRAMPRPAPLIDKDSQLSRSRRTTHLRLIDGASHDIDEIKLSPAVSSPYRTDGNVIHLETRP